MTGRRATTKTSPHGSLVAIVRSWAGHAAQPKAMLLSRLKVHGRSADIAVINRAFKDMRDPHAGLSGNSVDMQVLKVRYDFNKTWN